MGKGTELKDGGHRQADRLHHPDLRVQRGLDSPGLRQRCRVQVTGVIFSRNLRRPYTAIELHGDGVPKHGLRHIPVQSLEYPVFVIVGDQCGPRMVCIGL